MLRERFFSRILTSPGVVIQGMKDPALTCLVLNKMWHQYRSGQRFNRTGTDIFTDEDWDNLIILDACRYDEYTSLTPFDGPVQHRESRGPSSNQWVYGNMGGKQLHDTVYVSGNRWYQLLQEKHGLNAALHRYNDVERDAFDGYVPSPEQTTNTALRFAENYPNKRLIVHYMQPHKPYFGANRDRFEFAEQEDIGLRTAVTKYDIDRETLREAYRDNLRIVLDHVQDLVESIPGKTVISSDHGELLGERIRPIPIRWYGHANSIYVDELLTVPWQVVSDGPRKRIRPERPQNTTDVDIERVERDLEHLGYRV
jgi:hypothetical protein